jgi:hypothetical protein
MTQTMHAPATNFPVLLMEMTDHSLLIKLVDENACLQALFPKELVEELVKQWQAFQDGTPTDPKVYWRLYTGHWYKEDSEHAGEVAPAPERILPCKQ